MQHYFDFSYIYGHRRMVLDPGIPIASSGSDVKNPVLPHGASSIEKAIFTWGLCGFNPCWPFIAALPRGAFWLFHVNGSGYRKENTIRVSSQHSTNSPLQGLWMDA
jgi:hypothetical protein